jgi:hypothetical protein
LYLIPDFPDGGFMSQIVLFAVPPSRLTKKLAGAIAGSLGKPSKMPGLSYGISAKQCKVGSKLAKVPGSVCNGCHALKSNYQYPSVAAAHQKRLDGLASISWVDSMVKLISSSGEAYFRWHDSGDLQSLQHLLDIVRIAEQLPNVSFWLPTKEKGLVYKYRDTFGDFPANLCVRLSAAMVNITAPAYSGNTSTVHTIDAIGSECPAPKQGNKCLDCRSCWNRDIKNVSYKLH